MGEGAALAAAALREDGRAQMNLNRFFRHVVLGRNSVRRLFSKADLASIESAIRSAEQRHNGEIRFCVEGALDSHELLAKLNARQRAVIVFSELGVWNTEHNNGVLLYLLLADREFEIVSDRAVSRLVATEEWEKICREIEAEFKAGKFLDGVLLGIARISEILAAHFPGPRSQRQELSDEAVVLP